MSVVAVLVLLAIIATPFLVTMRDSAARGERFLYSARADLEADSLFEIVRAHLTTSLPHIERRRLEAFGGSSDQAVPENATPSSDTLAELQLPASVMDRFNRVAGKEHRVWDVQVADLQGRLNLNSCSFPVLANILGKTELADEVSVDNDRIPVVDASVFAPEGGVVRIGSEAVRYETIQGNELVGCERGYMPEKPENGGAAEHSDGAAVIAEAAFQIATRPFRARPGSWVRYTNTYQARSISAQGVTALSPQEFDRLRGFTTAWNGDIVGDGWSNPQLIQNAITPGDASDLDATLKNIRYFGVGTMVRITDGVNTDYAVVTEVFGSNQIRLAGTITNDYAADQARLYSLSRAPVNVNTAGIDVLTAVFTGLRVRGRGAPITPAKAQNLAVYLREWTAGDEETPGVYRSWEDFTNALDAARDEGIVTADEHRAVLLNAMNANDALLSWSTVPFVFRSFDIYEVRATSAILDGSGRELARREMTRALVASTTKSGRYVVESQDDFQNQIMKSRDGKWMATFPDNINAYFDGLNIPASEFSAFSQKARFPSRDRAPSVGDVRLLPAAYRFFGRNDRVYHFDDSDLPDGLELAEEAILISVDGPYSVSDRAADLVELVDVEGLGSDLELGLKPFSLSLWYQPQWNRDSSDHVIFDYGLDDDHMNRVSLSYIGETSRLVLACADATREQRSAEVFYEFDHTTWEPDQWYHIAVHVAGTHPGQLELFIDGEKQGQASGITRLTSAVPGTETISELRVEDASSFPGEGVVVVRGENGAELFEYTQRSDDTLTISRRKARGIDHRDDQDEPRAHPEGAVVELYGFAGPLRCDMLRGGASLSANIGPYRVYRFHFDDVIATSATPDSVWTVTGGVFRTQGLGNPGSPTLPREGVTLREWDTGSSDQTVLDDLGSVGTEGLALIVAGTAQVLPPAGDTYQLGPGSDGVSEPQSSIGGAEIVAYEVTDVGVVSITQRNLSLRHVETVQTDRFIPTYSYGSTDTNINAIGPLPNETVPGFQTAFIPFALVASGSTADYVDPDEEPQLGDIAYVQVDSEWFKYDTFDDQIIPGKVVFYRDRTLQNVAGLINGTGLDDPGTATPQQSSGAGGGTGGNSSSDVVPAVAQDDNDEDTAPDEPAGIDPDYEPPARTAFEIAEELDFRGMELRSQELEFRVANTIPRDHATSELVMPTCRIYTGNDLSVGDAARRAYPGFNDLLTFRDANGNDEQVRVQWGYMGWFGLTQATTQTWQWDRPTETIDLRRYDSRLWTRVLKFPSGERPDSALTSGAEQLVVGAGYDSGSAVSPAIVDEIYFPEFTIPGPDRIDYAFVGEVPTQLTNPTNQTPQTPAEEPRFDGIGDEDTDIIVHAPYYDAAVQAIVINGAPDEDVFPTDGGILLVDDELIVYAEFDGNQFSDCFRGAFGTQPAQHEYGARVTAVHSFATSVLTGDADPSTASFELQDTTDFPDDGYIRIAGFGELIGYTERDGNALSGPLGRFDPTTAPDPDDAEARVSGALFRGRFGTTPEAYAAGDVAIAMPFRHYDRYAEYADHPEQSYLQLSWTKPGAVWKRVTWSQVPRENIDVIALIRFAGGPPWDSTEVIRVGAGDQIPATDRRKHLFEISKPEAENMLNVESDRIEVRLLFRFAAGAYDRIADIAPDSWKQTPWIEKVKVEYVAPPAVLYEDK